MLPMIVLKRQNSWLDSQREFDRLFDSLWTGDSNAFVRLRDNTIRPKIDIEESDKAYVLYADLPGMAKEDIKITLEDGRLSIRGERKPESENKSYRRTERAYGSFERSFTLPEWIDSDAIAAHYDNGVLKVTVPKSDKVLAHKIKIG